MNVTWMMTVMWMMAGAMQILNSQQAQADTTDSGAVGALVLLLVGLLIIGLFIMLIVVGIGMASDASAASRKETTEQSIARVQHTGREARQAIDELSDEFLKDAK